MSQSKPANKEELKEFCLRQLGHPVIQINVDDIQVEDAVELASDSWRQAEQISPPQISFSKMKKNYLL